MVFPDVLSLPTWLLVTILVLLLLYYFGTKNHNYFKDRNVFHMRPLPFIGNSSGFVFRTKSLVDLVSSQYRRGSGHRCFGMFRFMRPIYMLRGPDVIRMVCVKEFDHFPNRLDVLKEDSEPLFGKGLFSLKDKRWRDMRATLSPAFTSSKIKGMFILVSEIGEQLADHLELKIKQQAANTTETMSLELKDLFTRFATDVIATTAFGVKVDSLKEPENEFFQMGKDATNFTGMKMIAFILGVLCPKLGKALGITMFNEKASAFFRTLVQDTITTREKEGIVRPDMIHLLMQAKKGELKAEEGEDEEEISKGVPKEVRRKLEDDDITAQAAGFFLAGFETVSTLMSFATHLLATHPDYRERVQQEIDSIMKETGNKLTYESVQKMKYLDMFISETLRLYPSVVFVDRVCVSAVSIPGTENDPTLNFQKDDGIFIPICGIHRDPEHFPEPERFDPERFSDDNKHNIKPFTYMPFGVGPRFCIAQRFALMEAKVALVHLLSRTDPCVVKKTAVPLVLEKKGLNMTAEGGFWVGFRLREGERIITG